VPSPASAASACASRSRTVSRALGGACTWITYM
jgi:hypothetical protein